MATPASRTPVRYTTCSQNGWSPRFLVHQSIALVSKMLSTPCAEDWLDCGHDRSRFDLFRSDRAQYDKLAREWTATHADGRDCTHSRLGNPIPMCVHTHVPSFVQRHLCVHMRPLCLDGVTIAQHCTIVYTKHSLRCPRTPRPSGTSLFPTQG